MGTRYGPVKLKIPAGFSVLLQRFAREVLREQPSDIVQFGANYFQSLLSEKLATGSDPLVGDPFDQSGFHGSSKKTLRPISSETRQNEIKENNAAAKIQAGFRGRRVRRQSWQERAKKLKDQQGKAATKIQARYRGYKTRKNLVQSSPADIPEPQSPQPVKSVENEQPQYEDSEENAAIRIQANFRGYQARKSLKPSRDKPKDDDNEPESIASVSHTEQAAKDDNTPEPVSETVPEENVNEEADVEDESPPDDEEDKTPPHEQKDEMQAPVVKEAESLDQDENVMKEETSPDTVDPDQEAAALRIQASFRGHRTRKQLKATTEKDAKVGEPEAAEGGGDADFAKVAKKPEDTLVTEELETQSGEQKADQSDDDNPAEISTGASKEEEDAAALRIQSQYRGYRVRKQQRGKKQDPLEEVSESTVKTDSDHAADNQE